MLEDQIELPECKHARAPAQTLSHDKDVVPYTVLKVEDMKCFGSDYCTLDAEPTSEECKPETNEIWGHIHCKGCGFESDLDFWEPTVREHEHVSWTKPDSICKNPIQFIRWIG